MCCEATTGAEALEVFTNYEGDVDLVVSDVVMPEMDGPTLMKQLRGARPDLKIIFISGYAEDAFRSNLLRERGLHVPAEALRSQGARRGGEGRAARLTARPRAVNSRGLPWQGSSLRLRSRLTPKRRSRHRCIPTRRTSRAGLRETAVRRRSFGIPPARPQEAAPAGAHHSPLWRPADLFLVRHALRRADEAVQARPL